MIHIYMHISSADSKCLPILNLLKKGDLVWKRNDIESHQAIREYITQQYKFIFPYFTLITPLSIMMMGVMIAVTPRLPMNIYSIFAAVSPEDDIIWLQWICLLINVAVITMFIIIETSRELFFILVSTSVSNALKLLTTPTQVENLSALMNNNEIRILIHDSLDRYEKLSKLVKSFNHTFSWSVFLYKAFTILRVCSYVYLLLRYGNNYGTGIIRLLTFPTAVVAISIRFIISMYSFGKVHPESEHFSMSMMNLISQMNPYVAFRGFKRKLKSLPLLGFLCGSFYIILPQTILTFYSVTITYQIVFLQL